MGDWLVYNDLNQWHYVVDRDAHLAAGRRVVELRAMSGTTGTMLVDKVWRQQRALFQPVMDLVVHYQKPYAGQSPERQATDFCALLGGLEPNERVLYDGERDLDVPDRTEFARRWLGVLEDRLDTLAQVYVPGTIRGEFPRSFTGDRIVKAPHYSGTPDWPHDVHQFTDRGPIPGGNTTGDVNRTRLTVVELLARGSRAPDLDWDEPILSRR